MVSPTFIDSLKGKPETGMNVRSWFIPGDGWWPQWSAFRASALQPSAARSRVPAPDDRTSDSL